MKSMILVASMFFVSAAYAHTTLQSSTPASGSIVPQSPERLTLVFIESTRLTSVLLVNAAGERRLAFSPSGSALEFHVDDPDFAAGRNEVQWRALSLDGHVVAGSVIVVVRAPAR